MTSSKVVAAVVALCTWAVAALPIFAQAGEGLPEASEGLRLSDVLSAVDARNPRLQAVRSTVAAAQAREPEASTLPDPMLQLGIMNFGLPDLNADMPTSMAPSIQLMQKLPFPGKLGLQGDIAAYATAIAAETADEARWQVRLEAAGLFVDLYALDRRLEVMRRTLALLRDFQDVANAMYVSGTGRQADVLRADVEVARMDADIRRLQASRAAQAARLNAVMDRPAADPVASPRLGDVPATVPERDTLLAWAHESRPVLEGRRLALERARAQVSLAGKRIWPDVTVGLTYGQRDRGYGTERMGSAMVVLSLPVHAGSRQLAARREAVAMEDVARAELTGAETSLDANVGVLLAELDRARRLTALYREEVVPEARATVESAFSSYRVGAVDFMTLVDAQMTLNRYQSELYQLLGDYAKAIAALESGVGRPLPRSGPMLEEHP